VSETRSLAETATGRPSTLDQPADIVAALRKHVDPSKVTVVKAGDFKK